MRKNEKAPAVKARERLRTAGAGAPGNLVMRDVCIASSARDLGSD